MESDDNEIGESERFLEVAYDYTPMLPHILQHLRASVFVTTYQAGKLLVLGVDNDRLSISFSNFDQPMGLTVDAQRLVIGSRRQMNFLRANRDVAPTVSPPGKWDVCFLPRTTTWTGSIQGHDIAWGTEGLWVVNTLFSCLSTLHDEYSFVPRWRPRFISQLIDQDRCHLNGLAMVNGMPGFVTAMSETDTAAGWRPTKATSGVLLDVASGETILRGLSMPHSPRWYDGKLWVLDSGRGALCCVDIARGQLETVELFPGYTRGLAFAGQFAFVGLSRIRETSVFGGVPIAEYREQLKCGIGVVDLRTGKTVAVFQFSSGVTEIFAVDVLQGNACPYVAGSDYEGKQTDVWIVPTPGTQPREAARRPWYSNPTPEVASRPVSNSESAVETWLESNPKDAAGWITLGNLLQEQNRQSEALDCYRKAIAIDPKSIPARQNYAYLLFNQGEPEQSQAEFDALIELDLSPMNQLLRASVLPIIYDSTEHIDVWRAAQTANLSRLVDLAEPVDASKQLVPTAFFSPYQGTNNIEQKVLRARAIRGDEQPIPGRSRSSGERLRVGFLSAYFRDHTIGRLNIGRLENLDRQRFESVVCSANRAVDTFSQRFAACADTYVQVPRGFPEAIAAIRSLKLDVLLFADVGMDALTSTLAHSRLAPVQCTTWGHPETTGSPCMDYFLSSELFEIESAQSHYTERLIRMPMIGTYYERPVLGRANDQVGSNAWIAKQRARLGLPESNHLYVCPQSLFKLHPDNDRVFREILDTDAAARLVMIEGRVQAWTERLKRRWSTSLGSLAERVIWLPTQKNQDYLSLLSVADVVLDPLHFGGGNSSYETLAMGVPLVTYPSQFLRGRITAGLYRRMGFDACVSDSPESMSKLALRLACDRDYRDQVVSNIRETSHILFSDMQEVRSFESAILSMSR
ncbi:MAG: TIGR03032 family protein [Pirellula sp.]